MIDPQRLRPDLTDDAAQLARDWLTRIQRQPATWAAFVANSRRPDAARWRLTVPEQDASYFAVLDAAGREIAAMTLRRLDVMRFPKRDIYAERARLILATRDRLRRLIIPTSFRKSS